MLVSYKAFVGWGRKKFFKRIGVIGKAEGGGGKGREGEYMQQSYQVLVFILNNILDWQLSQEMLNILVNFTINRTLLFCNVHGGPRSQLSSPTAAINSTFPQSRDQSNTEKSRRRIQILYNTKYQIKMSFKMKSKLYEIKCYIFPSHPFPSPFCPRLHFFAFSAKNRQDKHMGQRKGK